MTIRYVDQSTDGRSTCRAADQCSSGGGSMDLSVLWMLGGGRGEASGDAGCGGTLETYITSSISSGGVIRGGRWGGIRACVQPVDFVKGVCCSSTAMPCCHRVG